MSDPAPLPPAAPPLRVVAAALLVTLLWSSSWVFIVIGLEEVPALSFAAWRYGVAAMLLVTLALARPTARAALWRADGRSWLALAALGLVQITATQGGQFLALALLPALLVSLGLAATPVLVGLASWAWLGERPDRRAWLGIALFLVGAAIYLGAPVPARAGTTEGAVGALALGLPSGFAATAIGAAVLLFALTANSASALTARAVMRATPLPSLAVTAASMAIGAAVLAALALVVEGPPQLGPRGIVIVLWLAVVNTAFAFTLWNATVRRLPATTSSVLNNTMLIQIAILAWAFLGDRPGALGAAGLAVAAAGVLLHQWPRSRRGGRHAKA